MPVSPLLLRCCSLWYAPYMCRSLTSCTKTSSSEQNGTCLWISNAHDRYWSTEFKHILTAFELQSIALWIGSVGLIILSCSHEMYFSFTTGCYLNWVARFDWFAWNVFLIYNRLLSELGRSVWLIRMKCLSHLQPVANCIG